MSLLLTWLVAFGWGLGLFACAFLVACALVRIGMAASILQPVAHRDVKPENVIHRRVASYREPGVDR